MSRRTDIALAIHALAPRIPKHEFGAVIDHTLTSRGLSGATAERAAWLSLVAYVRHAHTDYDEMLAAGYELESARFFVKDEMQKVLSAWGVERSIHSE
jgi:hypothetical protein